MFNLLCVTSAHKLKLGAPSCCSGVHIATHVHMQPWVGVEQEWPQYWRNRTWLWQPWFGVGTVGTWSLRTLVEPGPGFRTRPTEPD